MPPDTGEGAPIARHLTALEKDIERKLRFMVERQGGQCLKWVCPGWSGVPDRIILLPGGRITIMCTYTKDKGEIKNDRNQIHPQPIHLPTQYEGS